MSGVRRFYFDRDFGMPEDGNPDADPYGIDLDGTDRESSDEVEIPQPEPEPEPIFTLEQLDMARQEGFAAGHASALQETADSLENRTAQAVESIVDKSAELFHAQREANVQIAEDAVAVAVAVMRKFFPVCAKRYGTEEIEQMVESIVGQFEGEPKITVRIHDSLTESVKARLSRLAASRGYADRIVIAGDGSIRPGDCVVNWSNGGAERLTEALWREIEAVVERNSGSVQQFLGMRSEPAAATVEDTDTEFPQRSRIATLASE